jgi:transposase InsO family protein
VPDERLRFVIACLEDSDSMAALCRRFGVSRRVGYKWLARYKEHGPAGLAEQSRAPLTSPNRVAADVERQVLSMRADHPTWGPRKLLAALARRAARDGGEAVDWPAASTVGELLRRAGLVAARRRRARRWVPPGPPGAGAAGAAGANRVWCADFKGWFRTADGAVCQPLTITDAHSRYLIRCQPLPDTTGRSARPAFEAAFREFGLPDAIRTDNGSPFASTGLLGLTQLSAWWVRLGIAHVRIDPGRPDQNGSHERMHGTLKREAASPPAATLRAQRARLDAWRRAYNEDRPHEGLPGMATPASLYAPSPRPLPARLPAVAYPPGWERRHVDPSSGRVRWAGAKVFLSNALRGQTVGLRDVTEAPAAAGAAAVPAAVPPGRYWRVRFAAVDLGVLDARRGRLLTARERRHVGW